MHSVQMVINSSKSLIILHSNSKKRYPYIFIDNKYLFFMIFLEENFSNILLARIIPYIVEKDFDATDQLLTRYSTFSSC